MTGPFGRGRLVATDGSAERTTKVARSSKDSHLDRLSSVSLFLALARPDLESLGRAADAVDVPAGATLVEQGAAGREFFIILSGEVSVRVGDSEVAVLKEGEWFG